MSSYYDGQEFPSSSPHEVARQSFQGPTEAFLATGWVEQLRRSKMQKVWKPVRLSLSKGDMTLWVEREHVSGQTETLQRIPISSVRRIGLVDQYMGERRFVVVVPDNLDDPQVMFRCDDPTACNRWITALTTVQQRMMQPNRVYNAPKPFVAPPAAPAAPPKTQQVPPPPPPPQDLLSFHVVTPTQRPAAAPPAPPRPLGAADFDPMRAGRVVVPSAPASAPSPRTTHATPSPPPPRPPPRPSYPPTSPHSTGSPWQHHYHQHHHHQHHQQQQQVHYYNSNSNRQAQLRQALLNTWALAPPHRQQLRSLDQLVTTVHTTFGLVAAPHAYLTQWIPITYDELCSHHVLDTTKVDKAVRKLRAFLHPDKRPADCNAEVQFLFQEIWNILHHVEEGQTK